LFKIQLRGANNDLAIDITESLQHDQNYDQQAKAFLICLAKDILFMQHIIFK